MAAFHHREPDRAPVFEYVLLSPLADSFLGRKYAGDPDNWSEVQRELGWEKAVRRSAADQVELAVKLGFDMMCAIPNPDPPRKSVMKPPADESVPGIPLRECDSETRRPGQGSRRTIAC